LVSEVTGTAVKDIKIPEDDDHGKKGRRKRGRFLARVLASHIMLTKLTVTSKKTGKVKSINKSAVGRALGVSDHSSVIYMEGVHKEFMGSNPAYQNITKQALELYATRIDTGTAQLG
jgi:hypothetical protein